MLLIHEKAETEKRNCVDREVCWKHTEWESDVRVCRSDCGWRWEMVNYYWALRDWWWLLSLQRGSCNVKIYATRCSETKFPLFLIVNFRWYTHCRCSWAYISSVMLLCRRHHHRRRVKPEIRAPAAWHTKKNFILAFPRTRWIKIYVAEWHISWNIFKIYCSFSFLLLFSLLLPIFRYVSQSHEFNMRQHARI